MGRSSMPVSHHTEGSHLSPHRRNCGSSHNFASRKTAWSAELDYRFCWLRDATFTLLALMHAGYYHEAQEWQNWLLRAIAGSAAQVQIMYGVAGERHLAEWEVPWLAGYQGASPVRVGNAAFGQQQLDVYGELADALHQAREGKLPKNEPAIDLQRTLLEHLEHIWQEPDEGIWEVRGPRRRFTHSKVMAWVAFDRTIKSAEKFGLKAPLEHWRAVRRQIHDDVCRHGFDPDLGSFVQSYGAKNLDASLLLVPLVGFLPPSDPRVRGTIEKIERDLRCDGLVQRYNTGTADDGLPPGEGAFLAGGQLRLAGPENRGREALRKTSHATQRRGSFGGGIRP